MRALVYGHNTRMWVNGEEVATPGHQRGTAARDAIDVDYTDVPPDADEAPPKR